MNRRFYHVTRDLHLYLGLFISPFVLLFSITVFYFTHAALPKFGGGASETRLATNLSLPDLSKLSGRPLLDALHPVLASLHAEGEIGFMTHQVSDQTYVIPVIVPGRATTVTLNPARREASIVTRETGLIDGMMTLHRSPGQHTPALSMNWIYMAAWRWFADATGYITLFLTVSGIYLWYVLRSERRIGGMLITAGACAFFGIVYVVSR